MKTRQLSRVFVFLNICEVNKVRFDLVRVAQI
jgi:hypothetical protein